MLAILMEIEKSGHTNEGLTATQVDQKSRPLKKRGRKKTAAREKKAGKNERERTTSKSWRAQFYFLQVLVKRKQSYCA